VRPIDRVLERLENVRQHNSLYMASCPVPDHGQRRGDRNPSLSITEGADGRVLLNCKAGCDIKDLVAAINLRLKDLFGDGGRGRELNPPRNGATVQHLPSTPHRNAEDTVAGADATPDISATVEDCILAAYAEYIGLPVGFLRSLGLKEIHYIDQRAVKMPFFDATGSEEVCVRFRVSLTGKPKVKTRKGDKHRLYGLWKIEEARQAGYVMLVEGESDSQAGWFHGVPVMGVPGATGFQSEWIADLEGVEKIYAIVEPDEGGDAFWQRLAATEFERAALQGHPRRGEGSL
jgi:hypothetical protein